MGRLNTDHERKETLNFIKSMKLNSPAFLDLQFSTIAGEHYENLRAYFALCAMARGKSMFRNDAKEIYDYSTGLVDMVLFTIASMYFVAGSYEVKTVTVQGNVGL